MLAYIIHLLKYFFANKIQCQVILTLKLKSQVNLTLRGVFYGKGKKNSDYNSIFATKLRDLISEHETTITEVANNINVMRQAVSAYQDGSSQPTADTLLKIANYFNVSTDYLLKDGNIRTTDTTIKGICEYTGLSEKALHKIKSWNETDDFQQFFSKILSDIIEAEEAQNLFCSACRQNIKKYGKAL